MATLVFVHGTTAGGWVWKHIASRLRDAGHEVYTPTLTGLGERVHLLTRESGTYDLRLVTASDEIPELDELYDQYMQRVSEPDAESARNNFIEFLESIITDRTRDLEVWELNLILKD